MNTILPPPSRPGTPPIDLSSTQPIQTPCENKFFFFPNGIPDTMNTSNGKSRFSENVQLGIDHAIQALVSSLIIGTVSGITTIAFSQLISKISSSHKSSEKEALDQAIKIMILSGSHSLTSQDGTIYPRVLEMLARAQKTDPNYPQYIKILGELQKAVINNQNQKTVTREQQTTETSPPLFEENKPDPHLTQSSEKQEALSP